jgi:CubicO group peptidase (beta-lactamase class C family)
MKTRIPFVATLFAATLYTIAAATDYYPPPDSQGGWRSLTSAADAKVSKVAGMDRQKLDEAFQYAQTTSQHGGLLVVRHGWLVYERYYGRGNREANPDMASCGKAFTSIACGIMLHERHDRIPNGLDEKVFTQKIVEMVAAAVVQ